MSLEVELQVFDGPLDLLLQLIEKNKINIFDIPIVEITDQYLSYVQKMEEEDLGVMSEFMVMAATLISIKCRMLLPREVDEEGEEIDPRTELVQQLLEYKTYKYMSDLLRDRMGDASRSFYKGDSTPKEVLSYRPELSPEELLANLTLEKLHDIFHSVIRRQEEKIDPVRSRFGTIEKEEVSLDEKLVFVGEYALEKKAFSFRELLLRHRTKTQIVVTFLAVLELMKYGILTASQTEDGEILLCAVSGADLSMIPKETEEYGPEGAAAERER